MQKQLIFQQQSKSLDDTAAIAKRIVEAIDIPACIYFDAPMGAGKTTLIKSIIQCFDKDAIVTSPTYSLMQEYPIENGMIYHLDLYRLESPEELEFFGLADKVDGNKLWLIEWPTMGQGYLPKATHVIEINGFKINGVRVIDFSGLM